MLKSYFKNHFFQGRTDERERRIVEQTYMQPGDDVDMLSMRQSCFSGKCPRPSTEDNATIELSSLLNSGTFSVEIRCRNDHCKGQEFTRLPKLLQFLS